MAPVGVKGSQWESMVESGNKHNIEVSGDSPVLAWLLAACGERAPWLHLEPDVVVIDWEMLLRLEALDGAPPLGALQKVLPRLPLVMFTPMCRGERAFERAATISEDYDARDRPLPTKLRQAFSQVVAEATALLPVLVAKARDLGTFGRDQYAIHSVNTLVSELRKAVTSLDFAAVTAFTQVQCRFDKRLVVAEGDVDQVMHRTISSRYGARKVYSPEDRLRVQRLARRLLRSNLRILSMLTSMVESGVPSGLPALTPDLAESCELLARLEPELYRLMAPRFGPADSCESSFVTAHQAWTTVSDEVTAQTSDVYYRRFVVDKFTGRPAPLGYCLYALENLQRALQPTPRGAIEERCSGVHLAHFATAVAAADAQAVQFNNLLATRAEALLAPAAVAAAIEWLFAKSPLLTLLASGVLQTYPTLGGVGVVQAYGFSLSAWLVASSVATKILGAEPMTYVDALEEPSEEADGDDGLGAGKVEVTHLTGRLLWERAHASLA